MFSAKILGQRWIQQLQGRKPLGTSLVVQWLSLCTPMPEAWVRFLVRKLDPQLRIPHTKTKTWCSQINKCLKNKDIGSS